MSTLRCCALAFVVLCAASTAHAQSDMPALATILDRHYEAMGGLDRIQSVQSSKAIGRLVAHGMQMELTMYQKRPARLRIDVATPEMTIVQAYDGQRAWAIMPHMGSTEPQDMPPPQAEAFSEQADMDGQLVDYEAKGHRVTLSGTEEIDGRTAYKLNLTTKNGRERSYYVDAETYLLLRIEGFDEQAGTSMHAITTLGDYRGVDGLMVPYTIGQTINGMQTANITFTSYEFDVPVEDSIFARPAGNK